MYDDDSKINYFSVRLMILGKPVQTSVRRGGESALHVALDTLH